MTKQLTREEAIEFADNKKYLNMSAKEIALFQLQQDCLCMPFDVFQQAVSEAYGYPVFTHQMVHRDLLIAEINNRGNES